MIRLQNIEDQKRGVVTYEFANGQRVTLDRFAVEECGASYLLRSLGYGHLLPTEPVALFQRGKRIGILPADFDPLAIKSKSPFYDPRPDDFRREGDAWVASNSLGPGDLESVPGFVWQRSEAAVESSSQ